MDKSEKRFERDIESFLISPEGGYTQFCGQDEEGNWVHNQGILIWDNLILFYIFFA